MKDQIIQELTALAKLGRRNTSHVVEALRSGEFDAVLADLTSLSVTEATDLVLDLAAARGIKC